VANLGVNQSRDSAYIKHLIKRFRLGSFAFRRWPTWVFLFYNWSVFNVTSSVAREGGERLWSQDHLQDFRQNLDDTIKFGIKTSCRFSRKSPMLLSSDVSVFLLFCNINLYKKARILLTCVARHFFQCQLWEFGSKSKVQNNIISPSWWFSSFSSRVLWSIYWYFKEK